MGRQYTDTPGGSSSGSGVAVAAGLAPWRSARTREARCELPAAWCGIIGLKATVGRISTYGVLPLSTTLDTPGPLARSVEDAALIFRVLKGADGRDPQTLALARRRSASHTAQRRRGLRLAAMPDAERAGVAAEVLAAYDARSTRLRGLGARSCDRLPRSFGDYARGRTHHQLPRPTPRSATSSITTSLPLDAGLRPRVQRREHDLRARLFAGPRSASDSSAEFAAARPVDALLTPTTHDAGAAARRRSIGARHPPFHALGQLFGSVCAGRAQRFQRVGLPLSLQIVCRGGDEATALRVGWAWQEATDWHQRVPRLPNEASGETASRRGARKAPVRKPQAGSAPWRSGGAGAERPHP